MSYYLNCAVIDIDRARADLEQVLNQPQSINSLSELLEAIDNNCRAALDRIAQHHEYVSIKENSNAV